MYVFRNICKFFNKKEGLRMRLPHAIDYYEMGDESFLDLKTKLCVVENVENNEIIIREIHHFRI